MLSLPASTAACERGFSWMRIFKTDYRNKLHCSTMTGLLTVKLLSSDVKSFDPLPAVYYFHQGRHRRPMFPEKKMTATQLMMLKMWKQLPLLVVLTMSQNLSLTIDLQSRRLILKILPMLSCKKLSVKFKLGKETV